MTDDERRESREETEGRASPRRLALRVTGVLTNLAILPGMFAVAGVLAFGGISFPLMLVAGVLGAFASAVSIYVLTRPHPDLSYAMVFSSWLLHLPVACALYSLGWAGSLFIPLAAAEVWNLYVLYAISRDVM